MKNKALKLLSLGLASLVMLGTAGCGKSGGGSSGGKSGKKVFEEYIKDEKAVNLKSSISIPMFGNPILSMIQENSLVLIFSKMSRKNLTAPLRLKALTQNLCFQRLSRLLCREINLPTL